MAYLELIRPSHKMSKAFYCAAELSFAVRLNSQFPHPCPYFYSGEKVRDLASLFGPSRL